MNGQRIGYIRVSTTDQNTDRQLDGLTLDRTYTDKASGKDTNRPQLTEAISYARAGDTLVIHSLDRLARNLTDLKSIVAQLTGKGVTVEFVKERLTFTGEDSPMSHLLLNLMGAFAEFERAIIRERQAEGIALAKTRGVYRGRVSKLTPAQASELKQRAASGETKADLARHYGISRETLYSYLRQGAA